MDTIVLKFGGSSVSDNIKLNIVADKIKCSSCSICSRKNYR